jgi:uncharacterized protein YndB with AHSA1/START domain
METDKTVNIEEAGKHELFNIRDFDAPREVDFKAFIEPELYEQWYGSRWTTMIVQTFEARNGGSWRDILKYPQGNDSLFHGVYHEVTFPERIIDTVESDLVPRGHVVLRTQKFEALPDDRTRFTVQLVGQSAADRDAMTPPGYVKDVNESYQRLDELLERMKKG